MYGDAKLQVINPILARLSELHRWPGKGRFALLIVNSQQNFQTSAKPIFIYFYF